MAVTHPIIHTLTPPASNVPVVSAAPSGPPPSQQYASQEEADLAEAIRRSQLTDGGANVSSARFHPNPDH